MINPNDCKHKELINNKCVICKKRFLYDNGLPFQIGLDYNIIELKKRIRKNKASLIIIDGFMGEGKTTLGVEVGEFFQDSELDFKTQLAYGGEEFIDKLIYCHKNKMSVLVYDEAGDFSKRGTTSKFNATLNRAFEIMRGFKVFIILCLPSFNALDSKFLEEGVCRMLLHTYDRDDYNGHYSGYDLLKMYKIKSNMLVLKRKGDMPALAYKFTKPNFKGHNLDLFPKRSKELNKISTTSKLNLMQELNNSNNNNLYTYKDLADKIFMSVSWVKKRCYELNIEPVDKKKNVSYFEPEVINILMDAIKK